jgi:hypothetical protein
VQYHQPNFSNVLVSSIYYTFNREYFCSDLLKIREKVSDNSTLLNSPLIVCSGPDLPPSGLLVVSNLGARLARKVDELKITKEERVFMQFNLDFG